MEWSGRRESNPRMQPGKLRPNLFARSTASSLNTARVQDDHDNIPRHRRLGGAATAILGHKMVHDRVDERERMATVTEQHYNRSQRIGLKAEGRYDALGKSASRGI
jgi:hypothetical protein